jgi:hypothetical protein
MNYTIQDISNGSKNPNENILMEITMVVIFVAIIVFSALVILGV